MKILVVEDENSIAELLEIQLKLHGYDVALASNGQMALERTYEDKFDLIILDMMMPIMTGFEFLEKIEIDTPVIALTAKNQLEDKIKGFSLGVDDYVTKPFEFMELLMRIKAITKRTRVSKVCYDKFNVKVDLDCRQITRDGKKVVLTLKEYDLLEYLIKNEGIALSRDKLLEEVWDYAYAGNSRTVDIHVQKLRSKLGLPISTVYKYGYRLEMS